MFFSFLSTAGVVAQSRCNAAGFDYTSQFGGHKCVELFAELGWGWVQVRPCDKEPI